MLNIEKLTTTRKMIASKVMIYSLGKEIKQLIYEDFMIYLLGASGGQRNRKKLNVNANNRSERAEQKNISLKSVEKIPNFYLTFNLGEADSRKWRQQNFKFFLYGSN